MTVPFPWVYPYQEDGPRLNSIVLRPVVPLSVVGLHVTPPMFAMVDSGAEHILAAPWVADVAGVDPANATRELEIGIGGEPAHVRFLDLTLRLHATADGRDGGFVEWQDEVGFLRPWRPTPPMIVGQMGFMKRFTVTMSRLAQAVAIEDAEVFDSRYPAPLASGG